MGWVSFGMKKKKIQIYLKDFYFLRIEKETLQSNL